MGSEYVGIAGMEAALHARDKVGVQDFVLLEDYKSVTAFVENLKKRFQENLIYTYIGPVLISVNPYKPVNIYNDSVIETYRNVNFYELPPHIFAVSDAAYRSMRREFQDQCVLISGESGSGKTEASKKILHYIACTSSSQDSHDIERVKDRLLQSNPILEAFGNAKTNRNDNSSRFGKYMDVQFDFKGTPVGGIILNYLLEKSRVVHHASGERNFHIFYQLVKGANQELRDLLNLSDDPNNYHYLDQGSDSSSDFQMNDREDFDTVCQALTTCDFSEEEQQDLFSVVAFVLHLGDVTFSEDDQGHANVNQESLEPLAKLIGCDENDLISALTHRSITAEGSKVTSPLKPSQTAYARDAFAKGIYERLFKWLVNKINASLAKETKEKTMVLGLLDIYGFEIFDTNCFEQFCINYCNEKLQQLFITLTLKSEQDEYLSEGIEWEPIQYFNNKIICDLVESKPAGIISILDEECLRPGVTTDMTFLEKLSARLGGHPHFLSYASADVADRKNIKRNEFRLLHYAGEVTYTTEGFLDKNNDLLFRDLKETMVKTTNPITQKCFPQAELTSKRRPDTAGTQFKSSLGQLMEILLSKQPSYIRCIKPNDHKQPNVFVEQIVRHQVKYLGLMENLRVRRAGFAYRRHYENFLHRYKCLCPETWPFFRGSPKDGVAALCQHLEYNEDDYKMGRTKLFIRFPRVLFATEDALQHRKHDLATKIQARFRAYTQAKKYQKMRVSATKIASTWRMYCAKKLLVRRREAAQKIRKFIKGFILRKEAICEENRLFVVHARRRFLQKLIEELPKSVLDKSWPTPPDMLTEASELLRNLNMQNLVRKYCINLSPEKKTQLEQKVVAERLFQGKKDSYKASIPMQYENSRLNEHQTELLNTTFKKNIKLPTEDILYTCMVTKYDRNGYKERPRIMVVTTESVYVLNEKDFKVKERIPFTNLKGITVSSKSDTVFIIHIDSSQNHTKTKGDFVLSSDYLYEALVKLIIALQNESLLHFAADSCQHRMISGREGTVEFSTGPKSGVTKGKKMIVVAEPVS